MVIKRFENFNENYETTGVRKIKPLPVIGLPSGQIIYMNAEQIKYFKACDMISYQKTWKKPMAGGFLALKLEAFCFEDMDFKLINELMNTIVWK